MRTERIDDLPLLISISKQNNLVELFDKHFPCHGNWKGASFGQVAVLFLSYILSCSDHRLSHVETWALERLHSLRLSLGYNELTAKDLTDDRLGLLLDKLSNKDTWHTFEADLNKSLLQVYQLPPVADSTIRLDAMITQSYRSKSGDFQMGFAKQHNSKLPQLKTMVAALDPFAMPLHSVTVSGNTSDDDLYLPLINILNENYKLKDSLFVGDSKMGSRQLRAYLADKEQYYLMPLNRKQCTQTKLEEYLKNKPSSLTPIYEDNKEDKANVKAYVFEVDKQLDIEMKISNEEGSIKSFKQVNWKERRVFVYSLVYAQSKERIIENRIKRASEKLEVMMQRKSGRPVPKNKEELRDKVAQVLKKHKVEPFFNIQISEKEQVITPSKSAYKPIKPRKKEPKTEIVPTLAFSINTEAQKEHVNKTSWQVYATNVPPQRLTEKQVVLCYRKQYKIEHKFNELMNKVTVLMPVFVQKENRVKALIRLLLIALKLSSSIQHVARQKLLESQEELKELFVGNPNRKTNKPTIKQILKVFQNITAIFIFDKNKKEIHVNPLSKTQTKILELLGLSPHIYTQFSNSNNEISET